MKLLKLWTLLLAALPLTLARAGYPDGWTAADYHAPASTTDVAKLVTEKTVRVIYMAPSDRAFRPDYRKAVAGGMLELQAWFKGELGGKTFRLNEPLVETCKSTQNNEFFASDSFNKVGNAIRTCGFNWQFSDPNYVWVVYADVLHTCNAPGRLGVGAPGITIMPMQDLQGLVGQVDILEDCGGNLNRFGWTRDRWIGGLGHEIGHAFGLPHPPGCDTNQPSCDSPALMWLGYTTWPRTYYRTDDRATLAGHGLLQTSGEILLGPSTFEQLNGTWFNPARSGEGALIGSGVSGIGTPTTILSFYTYTDDRKQEYVIGSREITSPTAVLSVPGVKTSGAAFGTPFNPADVVRTPWGTIELSLQSCNQLLVRWTRADGSAGQSLMERLAKPGATSNCIGT